MSKGKAPGRDTIDFPEGKIKWQQFIEFRIQLGVYFSNAVRNSELNQKAMWLAVADNGSYLCLVVDEMCQFMIINRQIIDKMPGLANGTDIKCIKNYARVNGNLIPVLDIQGILMIAK